MLYKSIVFLALFLTSFIVNAQKDSTVTPVAEVKKEEKKEEKKWYEWMSMRGYAQVRYNRLLATNDNLRCDQCDRSIGYGGGVFFRRARLVFSGNPHDRVFIYIQADMAQNAALNGTTTGQNFLNMRDLYGDIFLNSKKTVKLRLGLSKVPFGFDNIQSSQNRLAFDRTDAINSAMYNERDMGGFVYFTPEKIKDRFKKLQNARYKGTGDYGILGFGIFNGQTTNRLEKNDDLSVVARATYPFQLKSQTVEIGLSGFSGYFNPSEVRSAGVTSSNTILTQRACLSFTWYANPVGIQAEYNVGNGPEFTKTRDTSNVMQYSITNKKLEGGYVQISYAKKVSAHLLIPYARFQYYKGGKSIEADSRSYNVHDLEIGLEWQPIKSLELTTAYLISERRYEDKANPVNMQYGNLLRLQAQFNY